VGSNSFVVTMESTSEGEPVQVDGNTQELLAKQLLETTLEPSQAVTFGGVLSPDTMDENMDDALATVDNPITEDELNDLDALLVDDQDFLDEMKQYEVCFAESNPSSPVSRQDKALTDELTGQQIEQPVDKPALLDVPGSMSTSIATTTVTLAPDAHGQTVKEPDDPRLSFLLLNQRVQIQDTQLASMDIRLEKLQAILEGLVPTVQTFSTQLQSMAGTTMALLKFQEPNAKAAPLAAPASPTLPITAAQPVPTTPTVSVVGNKVTIKKSRVLSDVTNTELPKKQVDSSACATVQPLLTAPPTLAPIPATVDQLVTVQTLTQPEDMDVDVPVAKTSKDKGKQKAVPQPKKTKQGAVPPAGSRALLIRDPTSGPPSDSSDSDSDLDNDMSDLHLGDDPDAGGSGKPATKTLGTGRFQIPKMKNTWAPLKDTVTPLPVKGPDADEEYVMDWSDHNSVGPPENLYQLVNDKNVGQLRYNWKWLLLHGWMDVQTLLRTDSRGTFLPANDLGHGGQADYFYDWWQVFVAWMKGELGLAFELVQAIELRCKREGHAARKGGPTDGTDTTGTSSRRRTKHSDTSKKESETTNKSSKNDSEDTKKRSKNVSKNTQIRGKRPHGSDDADSDDSDDSSRDGSRRGNLPSNPGGSPSGGPPSGDPAGGPAGAPPDNPAGGLLSDLAQIATDNRYRLNAIRKALIQPPKFNHGQTDKDVNEWLSVMSNWLLMGRYPVEDWVTIACTFLLGLSADVWRIHMIGRTALPTWDEFKFFLINESGQRMVPEKARQTLLAVKHTGTTAEFLLQFQQVYSKMTDDVRPDVYTSVMILRDNMQSWLRRRLFPKLGGGHYTDLQEFITLAAVEGQECELLYNSTLKAGQRAAGKGSKGGHKTDVTGKKHKSTHVSNSKPPPKKHKYADVPKGSAALTPDEEAFIKESGRCFHCGDDRHLASECRVDSENAASKKKSIASRMKPPGWKSGDAIKFRKKKGDNDKNKKKGN